MANPQVENGYMRTAIELQDALCRIRIPGQARQILDTVFRKTYGFNKKEDRVALSQFVEATKLKKATVCKCINILKGMNLIIVTQKGNEDNIFAINKNYSSWRPLPKKVMLPNKVIIVTQKGNASLPNRGHTKDNTTKDNTKDIVSKADEPFNFEEELIKLKESNRKDHKIIALYWKKKKWVFENREQFNSALTRELRAAKSLKGYRGEEIAVSMNYCIREYPDIWTLETVFKRIQDLINIKK